MTDRHVCMYVCVGIHTCKFHILTDYCSIPFDSWEINVSMRSHTYIHIHIFPSTHEQIFGSGQNAFEEAVDLDAEETFWWTKSKLVSSWSDNEKAFS